MHGLHRRARLYSLIYCLSCVSSMQAGTLIQGRGGWSFGRFGRQLRERVVATQSYHYQKELYCFSEMLRVGISIAHPCRPLRKSGPAVSRSHQVIRRAEVNQSPTVQVQSWERACLKSSKCRLPQGRCPQHGALSHGDTYGIVLCVCHTSMGQPCPILKSTPKRINLVQSVGLASLRWRDRQSPYGVAGNH